MKTKSVLWASRHDIGEAQRRDLLRLLSSSEGESYMVLEDSVIIWESTESEEDDNASNAYMWMELASKFDAVCGVFPPSSLIALWIARDEADQGNTDFECVRKLRVFTPISEVTTRFSEKKFRYLRMQEI